MTEDSRPQQSYASNERRYSLREILEEVRLERRHSHFGRQLVDFTEIDKMFSKRKRKKKK